MFSNHFSTFLFTLTLWFFITSLISRLPWNNNFCPCIIRTENSIKNCNIQNQKMHKQFRFQCYLLHLTMIIHCQTPSWAGTFFLFFCVLYILANMVFRRFHQWEKYFTAKMKVLMNNTIYITAVNNCCYKILSHIKCIGWSNWQIK